MHEFVAFILFPINLYYFAVCFFKSSENSKSDNGLKLSLSFSTVPVSATYFYKSFETLQSATPLQLTYFISCILVFVSAAKFLVEYQWQTKTVKTEIHQPSQ
jgi:uncharacterized membrane protein YqhA